MRRRCSASCAGHLRILQGLRKSPPYPVGSAGYLLSRSVVTFIAKHDGDELPATDISLGLWLARSSQPVRLVSAPDAFHKAGNGQTCLRNTKALVCCHGSMGPKNMNRCGNSSWEKAEPPTETGLDALPLCPSRLPAPLEHRCVLFTQPLANLSRGSAEPAAKKHKGGSKGRKKSREQRRREANAGDR